MATTHDSELHGTIPAYSALAAQPPQGTARQTVSIATSQTHQQVQSTLTLTDTKQRSSKQCPAVLNSMNQKQEQLTNVVNNVA